MKGKKGRKGDKEGIKGGRHFIFRMQKTARFFFILVLLLPAVCFAQGGMSNTFAAGNKFYAQEKYEEAIAEYQKIVDAGFESGNLYYNMGNAYIKLGHLGKAILSYKRAKRLIPADSDLAANLRYAESVMEPGALIAEKRGIIKALFMRISQNRTLDGFTLWVLAAYLVLFGLGLVFAAFKGARRAVGRAVLLTMAVFIISSLSLTLKINYENQPHAVVTAEAEDARFEPFDSATVHFRVYEGQAVVLLKERAGWALLERNDGKFGWVKSGILERI